MNFMLSVTADSWDGLPTVHMVSFPSLVSSYIIRPGAFFKALVLEC